MLQLRKGRPETGYWGGGTRHADRLLRQKAAEIGCDALVIQGYVQGGARYRVICLAFKNVRIE